MTLRKPWLTFVALGGTLALGACSTVPVADETADLTKATTALKAQLSAPSQVAVADAAQAKAVLISRIVTNGDSNLVATCAAEVSAWRDQVIRASPAEADKAYKKLKAMPACPAVANLDGMGPPKPVQDAVSALEDYLDGLNAVTSASDSAAVTSAAKTLDGSLTALAKAANAPAPVQAAPAFFDKLASMALANAQYEVLKREVLTVDPLLDDASPPLIQALRIVQARQIAEVYQDAKTARIATDLALNHSSVRTNPTARLDLYDRLSPILDQLGTAQQASRVDPADTVRALIKAHHKLTAALKSDRGETTILISNAADLAGAAKDAFAPAAASSTGAKPGA